MVLAQGQARTQETLGASKQVGAAPAGALRETGQLPVLLLLGQSAAALERGEAQLEALQGLLLLLKLWRAAFKAKLAVTLAGRVLCFHCVCAHVVLPVLPPQMPQLPPW